MLCALLISGNDTTISQFQSIASKYGCILKVVDFGEECYEFAADTPFTAVFLDSDNVTEDNLINETSVVSRRFIKSEIYLFSNEKVSDNIGEYKQIIGFDDIENTFSSLFGQFADRPQKIFSSLRNCYMNDLGDIFADKRLIAIYPNKEQCVDAKIFSAFPVELLPERFDAFSDGNAVYAWLDASANIVNRICYHIVIELHNVNVNAFAIFTDKIENFESACQLIADVNAYATKLRLKNSDVDVCYYNDEIQMLEPFGNIIKKAQSTGFMIRVGKSDAKTEALLDEFFNQPQLTNATIVNIQVLVCEIMRSAFDDEVLYDNLFTILSSKSVVELKNVVMAAFTKERIGQGDLEVIGNERIIRQICDIIENEYATELYLDRVAEQIYLSPAYISRIFKKSTGMNFVKYLNEVRLKKAAALLLEADYPINEISKKVGFSDVSYFCSCFKKKYGMTTVQYRRAYVLKEIEV